MKFNSLRVIGFVLFFHKIHSHNNHGKESNSLQISTPTHPFMKDKQILKDSVHLLNLGKQALNLSTENPALLMGLVESSNVKADQIHHLIENSSSSFSIPVGEQYLVLSGNNGLIRVDNDTKTTDIIPVDNDNNVEDVFKIVMEKKYPNKVNGSDIFRRITIVESTRMKPFDENEFRRKSLGSNDKRHKKRHSRKIQNAFRSRGKRMKDESDSKYLLTNFPFNEVYNQDSNVDNTIRRNIQNDHIVHEFEFPVVSDIRHRLLPFYDSRISNDLNLSQRKKEVNSFRLPDDRSKLQLPHESKLNIDTDMYKDIGTESPSTTKSTEKNRISPVSLEDVSLENSLLMRMLQLSTKADARPSVFLPIAALMFVFVMCILITFLIYRYFV